MRIGAHLYVVFRGHRCPREAQDPRGAAARGEPPHGSGGGGPVAEGALETLGRWDEICNLNLVIIS